MVTALSRHPTRIQQIYGYAICLIAIVVGLIAVSDDDPTDSRATA